MTNTKKIILILIIVAIVAVAAFLILSERGDVGNVDQGGFSIREFFPFGSSDSLPDTETGSSGDSEGQTGPLGNSSGVSSIPELRKISEEPVAGAIILGSGTSTIVRFVEKQSGNVYEAKTDSMTTRRLTNTTIPKINRVMWLPNGEAFIAQTVTENGIIETSLIELNQVESSSSSETFIPYDITESKLPTGIKELSISPNGSRIFYYTIVNGVLRGVISNPDGTNATEVYTDEITDWIPQWYSESSILISSKASARANGYGFILNTSGGSSKVYGPIVGASALPINNNKVLVSTGAPDPVLGIVENGALNTTDINSWPEKCVLSNTDEEFVFCGSPQKKLPVAVYPDDWYKGLVNTSDYIMRLNIDQDYLLITSELDNDISEEIDVYKPQLSEEDEYLIFTNKRDQSLWLLRIATNLAETS